VSFSVDDSDEWKYNRYKESAASLSSSSLLEMDNVEKISE